MTTPAVPRPPLRAVILHLGGDPARLDTTIAYALACPAAHIIISSEITPAALLARFDAMGVPRRRLSFDFAAWDTVTNFTETRALVGDAAELYVVTGVRHMPRALAIAGIVYAGSGVRVTPAVFRRETMEYPEGALKCWWDVVRTTGWRWTGVLLHNPIRRWRQMRRVIRPAALEFKEADRAALDARVSELRAVEARLSVPRGR